MPDINYLKLLAEKYPNRRSVRTEIINLRAILALPKATEFFLSDIHGEYDAFHHFVRSGSGMIRMRIDEVFGNILTETVSVLSVTSNITISFSVLVIRFSSRMMVPLMITCPT